MPGHGGDSRLLSGFARLAVAAGALCAIAVGLGTLLGATAPVTITRTMLGTTPITVFALPLGGPAPVVVIAHGFAGSQQLMQPFAVTLARNGYVAVTFDFPGHGRNRAPLPGGLADDGARGRSLLDTLSAVVGYAAALDAADGRVALLGHSMASDIVVRFARSHPEVLATVGVSLFARDVTAGSPRNLLVIDGALEPAMLTDAAYRIVGMAAGGAAQAGVTYGSFAEGTARRLALADGVEHIGVLYSRESMAEALSWFDQAFGRQGDGFLDVRGGALGLLFGGLVALAWPLAGLLPRVTATRSGAGLSWRQLLPVAVGPALLTPLILWQLPTSFLPILLGDYLAAHFALYGVLTAAGLWLVAGRSAFASAGPVPLRRLAVGVLTMSGYGILVLGWPIDWFVTSFVPVPGRWPLLLAVLVGLLPYFLADEWLTRGAAAARGGYTLTKLCFLLSLALAVTLNPQRLFFLIIIVPAMLIFFVVYGLLSGWAYQRTHHPLTGALANALAFAWAITVTFPVVG